MPVVNGFCARPDLVAQGGVSCQIELADGSTLQPVRGFTSSTNTIVGPVSPTLTAGAYSVTLPDNAAITPANTVYRRTWFLPAGVTQIDYYTVPTGGGPYPESQILAQPLLPLGQPLRVTQSLPFITVPSDWGGRWRQALSQASSRLVRVAFLADSIGTGLYARNISASGTRWVGGYVHQVRDRLQAVYGDGGSGWADNRTNRGVFGGMELGAETGSWAATLSGVNDAPRKPATPGNGATETFPFDGTIVDIVTQTDTGFGSLTYSIDAGTGVVLNQNIADSIQVTTVTGLAPGAHTLKFTASTGDSKPIGVRGRNATGVIVDNMSSGGRAYSAGATGGLITAATDGWATETTMSNTATALGPIDLLIMVLGVNDLTTSTDIWASSTGWHALGTMFERAQSLATAYGNPPEMVVVIPHFGAGETDITTLEGPQLAVQLRTFAASIGAAVVDVWGAGRRSWNYWDSLGYWPDPFATGKDAVHPNIGGHTVYADLITSLLTNPSL